MLFSIALRTAAPAPVRHRGDPAITNLVPCRSVWAIPGFDGNGVRNAALDKFGMNHQGRAESEARTRDDTMIRLATITALVAVFTSSSLLTPAHAASFDCGKATTQVEVTICQNPQLSEQDTEMAALWFAFNKVPMLMGANAARRDAAADFLRLRDDCGSDAACLGRVYDARIAALRAEITAAMDALADQQ
jgi:hypothetical protein